MRLQLGTRGIRSVPVSGEEEELAKTRGEAEGRSMERARMGVPSRRVMLGLGLVLVFCLGMWMQVNAASENPSLTFVKKTIASHSIVIFSKSYCPYCKRAKSVFKELNETPFVVELDLREDGGKIQAALSQLVGRRTVPQVFIDGEHIGGSDDTVEAYNNGKLQKLLNAKQSGEL